jgi:hypothetical protein
MFQRFERACVAMISGALALFASAAPAGSAQPPGLQGFTASPIDAVCVGGKYDGQVCSDTDALRRCERAGGACLPAPQKASVSCTHDSASNTCVCECHAILSSIFKICMENLRKACRVATNCDATKCDESGCTWTGVDPDNCPK